MKLNEIMTPRSIIIVCGNIASGKGYFIQNKYPDYQHISVSGIVKSLINSSERNELSKTSYLDKRIIEILIEQISCYDKVIVDGIRQPQIIHALEAHFKNQIKDVIWLDVSEETLRKRYESRGHDKDKGLSFDQAIEGDRKLGIGDVEKYIRGKGKVVPHDD